VPLWIVDSSVAVKWYLDEVYSEAARSLVASELAAPSLLLVECANVFWRRCRIGDIKREEAQFAYETLAGAPLELHDLPGELGRRALQIGLSLNHPVYDCVYLALAERLGIPLVTADTWLKKAVSRHERYEQLVVSVTEV
jgi:predicted nucleic acid-binding protein